MRAAPVPAFSPPDLITATTVQEGDLVAVMGTIVPGPVGWSDPWGNDSGGFWITTMHPFGTEPFVRVLAEAPEGFQVVMVFGRVHWWNGRAIVAGAEVRFWGHSYEWWREHRYDERERPSRQSVAAPTPRQPRFGILDNPEPAHTIPEAKEKENNYPVLITAPQIVTVAGADFFYIETDNRACGIRVEKASHGLSAGARATVSGDMATNSAGERYIAASSVGQDGTGVVGPLSLNSRCLGGGDWLYDPGTGVGQRGVTGCQEMNNIGLLVRVFGMVTFVAQDGSYAYLDDGSALNDGSGHIGVRVERVGSVALPRYQTYGFVTGVSSMFVNEGNVRRRVIAGSQAGVSYYAAQHVNKATGNDNNDGFTWATAKKTIQAGIDAAAATDPPTQVWVAAETYEEPVELDENHEDVGVYGGFDGTEAYREERDWVNNETVIDGQGERAAVYCHDLPYGHAATIDGFIIQNGDPGIECDDAALLISHNTITDNAGTGYGGGVYCSNSWATFADNDIVGNTAWHGAGLFLHSQSGTPAPQASVVANRIWDNAAGDSGGGVRADCWGNSALISQNDIRGNSASTGGGIWASGSQLTVAQNAIVRNSASGPGGGMYCYRAVSLVGDNEIAENTAGSGGGIDLNTDSSATVADNVIRDNLCSGSGGGISCSGAPPVIAGNTVTQNRAGVSGGGIWCSSGTADVRGNSIVGNTGGDGGGMFCSSSSPTIANNTIANNAAIGGGAADGDGGGIYCAGGAPAISGNVFDGNSASYEGGAIHCAGSAATIAANTFDSNTGNNHGGAIALHSSVGTAIVNNLFLGNSCSGASGWGGGAVHSLSSGPTIANNTFVENRVGTVTAPDTFTPAAYGGAIHVRGTPQTKVINNVFSGNLATSGNSVACTQEGVVNVSYSDAWPAGQTDNYYAAPYSQCNLVFRCMYENPLFYNPGGGQYWLGAGSALRTDPDKHGQQHASDPDVPQDDIEGHPRPGPDALTDMGAYENDGRP